jgi:hypothetical protein
VLQKLRGEHDGCEASLLAQVDSFSSQAARGYFCEATPLENSKREEVFSVAFRYTESNAQHEGGFLWEKLLSVQPCHWMGL